MPNLDRLRDFVMAATRATYRHGDDEPTLLNHIKPLLQDLVAYDDWLPDEYAVPDDRHFRQYLLHADPLERLSIISFVWGPGQKTSIHDHLVWGAVGVLRGAETSTSYTRRSDGTLIAGATEQFETGSVFAVSPMIGDIHKIANAFTDRSSVSIHVYGGNIGAMRRHAFDSETGEKREFISGYCNSTIPNLWDRSRAI